MAEECKKVLSALLACPIYKEAEEFPESLSMCVPPQQIEPDPPNQTQSQ